MNRWSWGAKQVSDKDLGLLSPELEKLVSVKWLINKKICNCFS